MQRGSRKINPDWWQEVRVFELQSQGILYRIVLEWLGIRFCLRFAALCVVTGAVVVDASAAAGSSEPSAAGPSQTLQAGQFVSWPESAENWQLMPASWCDIFFGQLTYDVAADFLQKLVQKEYPHHQAIVHSWLRLELTDLSCMHAWSYMWVFLNFKLSCTVMAFISQWSHTSKTF